MSHDSEAGDSKHTLSRRDFVRLGALTGTSLALGIRDDDRVFLLSADAASENEARVTFNPNPWITIDSDGMTTIVAANSEMGQGVRTAIPMIVAEELGADWSRVRVIHARPGPSFQNMRTSGSGSVPRAWRTLRPIAASAREMLITAAAATWRVDRASCVAEKHGVVHQPTGRRLEFGALVADAARLPVPETAPLKPTANFSLVGTRVRRVDAPLMVNGRAKYGIDVQLTGLRYAAIVRSPRVGATLQRFDATRARSIPGVIDAVRIPSGVAVIANRTWAALKGRDAVEAQWNNSAAEQGGSVQWTARLEASLASGKRARHDGGDVDAALAGAAQRIEHTYYAPFQSHAAMEPLNCTVALSDGRCEIWVGSQAPNQVHEEVAKLLGLRMDQVEVNIPLLGGGFGRRLDVDFVLEAVEVARAAKAPVKVMWTREDDMRHGMYQPAQVNRLTAGIDAAGKLIAWRHRVADFNLTMFGDFDPNFDPVADEVPWGGFDTPYSFPALDVTLAMNKTPVPTGAWRAVAYPASVFARESLLDEVAVATKRDPIELRLSVLQSPGIVRVGSRELPNGERLRRVLQLVAERSGWQQPFARVRGERRWGRGVACNSYHNQTMVAQVAEVSVGPRGDVRVHRVVCAVDCGRAINRLGIEGQFESGVLWALSSALKGQMTFEAGRAVQGNYNSFPVARMTDAPVVEVHIVDSELPAMGVGEQPVPPLSPAVFNAVFAATGKRIRRTPLVASDLQG